MTYESHVALRDLLPLFIDLSLQGADRRKETYGRVLSVEIISETGPEDSQKARRRKKRRRLRLG